MCVIAKQLVCIKKKWSRFLHQCGDTFCVRELSHRSIEFLFIFFFMKSGSLAGSWNFLKCNFKQFKIDACIVLSLFCSFTIFQFQFYGDADVLTHKNLWWNTEQCPCLWLSITFALIQKIAWQPYFFLLHLSLIFFTFQVILNMHPFSGLILNLIFVFCRPHAH